MPDIFDTLTTEKPADIFDTVASQPKDIFDSVGGDIFDTIKPSIVENIKQHPFKSILQPITQTLGVRSPSEIIKEKTQKELDSLALRGRTNWLDAFGRSYRAGVAGD